MGEFKEAVKLKHGDQDDPAHKGWGEDKDSPFNSNGITLIAGGAYAGVGHTGFDGGWMRGHG
ncbi:MAG: hypothetical protein IPP74_15205 [Alphaproteobacteria bacterium]|nr:hypothetical protein [Alphaproteobacteria bacterium]